MEPIAMDSNGLLITALNDVRYCKIVDKGESALIARYMGPTWGPPGSCRSQVGPMLAPWALLSGWIWKIQYLEGKVFVFRSIWFSFITFSSVGWDIKQPWICLQLRSPQWKLDIYLVQHNIKNYYKLLQIMHMPWHARHFVVIYKRINETDLSNLSLENMAAISQTIFSDAFSWMKSFAFWFKFYWSLFLTAQLTINQHWFRWRLGAELATSHYLNQCRPDLLTHICDTRGGELSGLILNNSFWDDLLGPFTRLTHWGRVTHICVGNLTIIGSDNGLSLVGANPLAESMLEYC